MMPDARKARLELIGDCLESDENVLLDVLALLLDPGQGLSKREAEGYLVLTNRRLMFGTAKHGILIDLPTKKIQVPVAITHKFMMARLLVKIEGGAEHTLVVNKGAARQAALAINKAAST
jgi:hypothetical protein